MGETVQPADGLFLDPVFRPEVLDLGGHLGSIIRRVEVRNPADPVPALEQGVPERLHADSDRTDDADTGNDDPKFASFFSEVIRLFRFFHSYDS
jgi:hypothetical protein